MQTEKYFHIKVSDLPIYKGKVIIILSNDLEQVKKTYPDFHKDKVFASAIYDDYKGWKGYYFILDPTNENFSLGIIAHECFHISNMILSHIGHIADLVNDETHAYLIGYLCDEVYDFMQKKLTNHFANR